ncbi:uncharacterized protein LOC132752756 isoform X5 [Ruditapes philippinarum]|uniref:uncharacterized protein LOC132752756 isoform X5 n=1 Tax=Ruditapes philippinarum TaxID=129788 RepID=UPI00295C056B|nr:uncharacterized protein LOC132752756 isoform X5 [Ruditapes philippinarum]
MAGTYYHQEALRKARLIERKTEAMRRLQDSLGDSQEGPGIVESKPSNLVFSEAGHYAQNSLNERIHHRRCRAQNEGDDHVLPLMNPPEYNFTVPVHELPPRKPHFKV